MTHSLATPPVLAHSSWRHLLRELTATAQGRCLRGLPREFLQTALVAPVTLARWLAQDAPHLLERPALHLVVAGAAKGPDSLDGGRWYQLLAWLLGRPQMTVRVSLVGPELKAGEDHPSLRTGAERAGILRSAGAPAVASLAGAEVCPLPLAQWHAARAEHAGAPDACFVFHPAMEAFGGSWASREEGLVALMDAGVPVGLAASCVEELWHDDWLSRRYGLAMRAASRPNPFALEREAAKFAGAWGALTWSLDPAVVPPVGFKADRAELVRFYLALEQAQPGFSASGNAVFGFVGGVVPIARESTGETARLVGLPAGVLLCLESGQVLGQNTVGRFEVVERIAAVPLQYLQDFPGEAAHPVDRFIWACEKFRGYIEAVLLTGAHGAPQAYFELFGSPLDARRDSGRDSV